MAVAESSSGSLEFDQLRTTMQSDRQLRNEVESLMLLLVETYNPSDRGVRFITGGIGEWMLAFAAYSAGVLTLPAGHNANGFDLRGVLERAKGLWSVKGSNRSGGDFIISNGRNGPGAGFVEPTVFWSPDLPGMVFADPRVHEWVAARQRALKDSTVIAKSVISEHAEEHPECVIQLDVPENPGTATKDPAFEAVKLLVSGGNFPRLRKMLEDAVRVDSSLVGQLQALRSMRDAGDLSPAAYEAAVEKLTGLTRSDMVSLEGSQVEVTYRSPHETD